jgi:L-rhamnose mutarotase
MKRVAFTMKLKPGCEAEYRKRHDEIWPELSREIKAAGISDYTISLHPDTLVLYASQKVEDEGDADSLSSNPIVRRWWSWMADLMETNDDDSPVCESLIEVFHMA